MTNSCAVPTCNTGRKSIKEKRSVFKVPADVELRKKWIAAIPGILQLMPSQFVCEKHFLQSYIRRKWTKCDSNGRVIAEVPYSRIQLDPLAVPTEFDTPSKSDNVSTTANVSIEKHVSVEHSYCSPDKFPDKSKAKDGPMKMAISSSIDVPKSPLLNKSPNKEVSENDISMVHLPPSTKNLSMDCSTDSINDRIEKPATQDVGTNEISPLNATAVESVQDEVEDDCEPTKTDCHFHISEVTFSCVTDATVESISIPRRWTVCELNTTNRAFLFSYYVTKIEKDDNLPVMERNVKLNFDKELRYYVYGRVVDVHGWNFPQVLDDVRSLPRALEKFKNTNLCNGLGAINAHLLSSDNTFKDYVDRWHHKNCTLISKYKRCAHCVRTRGAVLKREARSKKEGPANRIYRASNPIDQSKINALRKKIASERRLNNRVQKRIERASVLK